MEQVITAFWGLSIEMGVYILFGLFAAGILHQLVDEGWIRRHLGKQDTTSVYKAALFGTPLPLCSCSVIPFAASLRRSGASKGATLSFLIATPITGIDSIMATFGMFGWAFTLFRLISSVLLAILAGVLMNDKKSVIEEKKAVFSAVAPGGSGIGTIKRNEPVQKRRFSWKEVFSYGFITLLGSFSKPLIWGLVIGALITAAIPQSLDGLFGENRWLGYFVAVAISAPMYVCATASLPIAASLVLSGVSPGAVFVFLSAGPATNTVTMGVVKTMLGTKALIVYLTSIVIGSVLFGALIDLLFDTLNVTLDVGVHEKHGWIEIGSAIILLGLLGWNLLIGLFRKEKNSCSGGSCCS